MVQVSLFSTWLTPTSLFILLNIVIATILFASSTTNHPSRGGGDPSPLPQPQPHLARPPSFLSRVMSFSFPYGPEPYPEPQHLVSRSVQPDPARSKTVVRPPSFFSRVVSFNYSDQHNNGPKPGPEHPAPEAIQTGPARTAEVARPPSLLSRVASFGLQGLSRGVQAAAGEGKGAENESRESREVEKEKTTTSKKKKKQQHVAMSGGGGRGEETTSLRSREEVDAKADDFINRFKQQLKMQRLESLLRRNSG